MRHGADAWPTAATERSARSPAVDPPPDGVGHSSAVDRSPAVDTCSPSLHECLHPQSRNENESTTAPQCVACLKLRTRNPGIRSLPSTKPRRLEGPGVGSIPGSQGARCVTDARLIEIPRIKPVDMNLMQTPLVWQHHPGANGLPHTARMASPGRYVTGLAGIIWPRTDCHTVIWPRARRNRWHSAVASHRPGNDAVLSTTTSQPALALTN
jgi:hypothetical protein